MSQRLQLDLLVGRRVYDSEGRKLGRVDEILLVREGDRYEVEGLLIGVNGLAERLGVARPLKRIEKRLDLRTWRTTDHVIYWEQIDSLDEKAVRLAVPRREIQTVPPDESSRG
ncbi:MAG: PRC-barrel domain-containing protein [Actinomycetota bacterium]|nr:PRC-barrel domain-containing protein [Actinomycetota bacterium]